MWAMELLADNLMVSRSVSANIIYSDNNFTNWCVHLDIFFQKCMSNWCVHLDIFFQKWVIDVCIDI